MFAALDFSTETWQLILFALGGSALIWVLWVCVRHHIERRNDRLFHSKPDAWRPLSHATTPQNATRASSHPAPAVDNSVTLADSTPTTSTGCDGGGCAAGD